MSNDKTMAGALTRFRCAGYDPTDGSGPVMVADPDGPWMLAADVIGTSSDCEATPASSEDPESGGDWFGDVLGSIGDVIPLATVKHGGCVQLGDGLPPLPIRQRFTTLHGETYAYSAEQMREYALAALSAQPSPGGQDALKALDDLAAFCSDDTETVNRHVAVIRVALAARQPVAQEPVVVEAVATIKRDGDGELYVDWLTEGGIHDLPVGDVLLAANSPITNDEGYGEVYAAPQGGAK